jgi:hypothetical protein
VRVARLLVGDAVLIIAFPLRGKRRNGRCPSNSRYVLFLERALAVNSSPSTRTATRERHK